MYGCNVYDSPEETRLMPFLLSKICPFFSFSYSKFGNQKSKEATARVALFNEVKIPNIFTMESSFCGMNQGPYAHYHFSTDNLMQTGRDFCRILLIYCTIQSPGSIISTIVSDIMTLYKHYKNENEGKEKTQRDQETDSMKLFEDKIT